MYYETLKHLRITTVTVLKHYTLHVLSVCSFMWPFWSYHFHHYLINSTIFGKKVIQHKTRVMISIQILSEAFFSLKTIRRSFFRKCTYVGLYVKCRHSCQILMKLELFQQNFERYWSIKFRENSSSGSRVVACGQRDGHDKLIVAFRNVGDAPEIVVQLLHLMCLFSSCRKSPQRARAFSFTKFIRGLER